MSSGYYYKIDRKSYEFDQETDHATTPATTTKLCLNSETNQNIAENLLLQDYEVVDNIEFQRVSDEEVDSDDLGQHYEVDYDEDEIIDLTRNTKLHKNYEHIDKLNISLSAEKIALKSQTAKIDNSIVQQVGREANKLVTKSKIDPSITATLLQRTQQQEQQLREQHGPTPPPAIAFTIVPINLAKKYQQTNNLPEIILTSFDRRNASSAVKPKAATVTFQTALQQQCNVMSPPLCSIGRIPPPPLEAIKRHYNYSSDKFKNSNIKLIEAETELYNCEDNSEIISQPGSSTSPESLMDNILSEASASIRSSSLSSGGLNCATSGDGGGGTEIIQLDAFVKNIEIDNIDTVSVNNNAATTNTNNSNDDVECVVVVNKNAVTKERHVNRSLNSKSPELKISPSLIQATSITTTYTNTTTTTNTTNENITLAPASEITTTITTRAISPTIIVQPPALNESKSQIFHLPPPLSRDLLETNSIRSRSPSPINSVALRNSPEPISSSSEELKCLICAEIYRDPRTLNCLHSFCFQCIVDENFKQDSSIPFWAQPDNEELEWKGNNKVSNYNIKSPSPEISLPSCSDVSTSPSRQRRSSFSFRRKKSVEKASTKSKSDGKTTENASSSSLRLNNNSEDKLRIIICKICNFSTEVPVGGIRQLPQNFILTRRIEEIKLKAGDDVISRIWCSQCFDEINATYHCITCTLNLCTLCKESHERQRHTANHKIRNIMDLRKARRQENLLADNKKFTLKCSMHPGFDMKSFCSTCLQVACADCLVLLHKGHKHESIAKAIANYSKILRESVEQTRPLCNYAEHSIERLNQIAKGINRKCDDIQAEVEAFMAQYFEAVEVHQKTLLQQVSRARESKVEIILEQQLDLEKRNNEAMEAVHFTQELSEIASDVEILSFVNILLKRFEYCQQFKLPIDPKISDSLHFLPEIPAPSTKNQNHIPLFGIITMQTVEPSLCTLQWEGFSHLRLHKKADLVLLSRDADGVPLCHGGLHINVQLKYKENASKFLPVEISDHRDGTYGICFTPDAHGTIILTVTINDKPIKGNPFTFLARTVRPHSGIYHCCAFCSSKSNKMIKCSCEGRMPGYNGCGHGHVGHPGRRHWSCCGNVLENSECNVANKMLNP